MVQVVGGLITAGAGFIPSRQHRIQRITPAAQPVNGGVSKQKQQGRDGQTYRLKLTNLVNG